MLKAVLLIAFLATVTCQEGRKRRVEDPFAILDKHLTHTLSHHLWPWNQIFQSAAALEDEDALENPKIVSDANKLEIKLNVKRFKPDELKIKVNGRNVYVEGNRNEANDDKKFMVNNFEQRFDMPPSSKQEEVTAVLNENGVLTVTMPKSPTRIVPIEMKSGQKSDAFIITFEEDPEEEFEEVETTTENKEVPTVQTSSQTPLEQLDLVEATTHVGKIRKKELKPSTKTSKDNEVTKGIETNGLEYQLVE